MKKQNKNLSEVQTGPKRRLSIPRLFLAILVFFGISYSIVRGFFNFREQKLNPVLAPWFAPYVDVTATPSYPFEQVQNKDVVNNLVLSFIVSNKDYVCSPAWGGEFSLDAANEKLNLDRRIARFRQFNGQIAISFGGQRNHELSIYCSDETNLKEAYKSVIERYDVRTLDFDFEGEDLKNTIALKRNAKVIAALQKNYRSEDKGLAVWLTLPVTTAGLTKEGTDAVSIYLNEGVDLAGINAMTMNFGASKGEESMAEASKKALIETQRQIKILYSQSGINLSETSAWSKIGATPMIGQNDMQAEVFSLEDAKKFNEFATSKHIGRFSMWSGNRDTSCGQNYVNLSFVSDSCSGVPQNRFEFAEILKKGFLGDILANVGVKTENSPVVEVKEDNPAESPYQIWNENGTYVEGTKVVWHGQVYQAKWWTGGDYPDNPVLQSFETPWQLIGPVLPGETPIPQATIPPGTYPNWSGTAVYDAGKRVIFNGVAYQAKWWTQGDSPVASNPDDSPWKPLTEQQIKEILGN